MKDRAFVWARCVSSYRVRSRMLCAAALLVVFHAIPSRVDAENNTSYTYNGTTTNLGAFTIGNNGTNNVLDISNAGAVTNTTGTLGTGPNGSYNSAFITNAGSLWVNTGDLYIGNDYTASSNTMIIADGGVVSSLNGYQGAYGQYNSVLITGPGSAWIMNQGGANGYFEVGVYSNGSFNQLTVANGGLLYDVNGGYIGNNAYAGGNSVTVTGSGSVWSNGGPVYVGSAGSQNQLIISNSGRVQNTAAVLGQYATSRSNSVTVSGLGSVWNNSGALTIGHLGGQNQMIITNGGRVNNTTGWVGYWDVSASNNLVVVSGPGSVWSNSDASYGLVFGWSAGGNQLIVSDGGRVDSVQGYVGYFGGSGYPLSDANRNSVLVTGSNSLWNIPQYIEVGVYADYNSLTISNGGRVNSGLGAYIGNTGASNTVLVTGTGSVWSNSSYLYVGMQGMGNQLILADGAQMQNTSGTIIGFYHGSNQVTISGGSRFDNQGNITFGYYGAPQGYVNNHNSALVTGSNSVWTTTGFIDLGYYGTDNQLVISNGGRVLVNGASYIGDGGGYNLVDVTGAGSVWSNGSTLFVGNAAPSNSLRVTDGARLSSVGAYIGYLAAAGTNSVILAGPNTVWENNNADFYVGNNAGNNSLVISNGARVNNREGRVAWNTTSSGNNTIAVTGPDSVWSNSSTLTFGDTGGNNQMTVSAGARIDSADAYVGYSDGNTILLTGSNTFWSLPGHYLEVGLGGRNNRLTIDDGAQVVNAYGYVALGAASTGNVVVVSGPGAHWTNSSTLAVGYSGPGNTMIITNGGRVDNTVGFISQYSSQLSPIYNAGSNTVIVTGSNSVWNNTGDLYMGQYGGGYNRLLITDGGRVNDAAFYTGYSYTAGTNTLVVAGYGSVWSNSGNLILGYNGGGDSLTISGGGRVDAANAYINYYSGNNSALVTGSNSLLSAPAGAVELSLNNAFLTIADGARVVDDIGYLGAAGTNNIVLVTGAGSQWSNNTLYAGYSGPNNRLTISNGGRVDDITGYIGAYGPGYSPAYQGNSNTVVVTGSNSVWNNNTLYMGLYGSGGNTLLISDGGHVNNIDTKVGWIYDGGSNTIVVSGPGSTLSNSGSIDFSPYGASYNTGNNRLIVTNGGRVTASYGYFYAGDNNSVLVSGSNSIISFVNYPESGGDNTTMTISKGGRIESSQGYIGGMASKTNNILLITDPGSQWTNTSSFVFGYVGPYNQMIISNGARLDDANGFVGFYGPGYSSSFHGVSNTVVITGANSLWNNTSDLYFGSYGGGGGDKVLITDGGRLNNNNAYFGYSYEVGAGEQIVVSGAGSVWSNAGTLYLGYYSAGGNQVTVTNGGRLYSANGYVGGSVNSGGSAVHVTGADSLWQVAGTVNVGSNSLAYGNNQLVEVTEGGTLEASSLISGFNGSGTISNRQGIYQFATATPTITTNTAGSIYLGDGTISYRDVAAANIFNGQVSNITFAGNNTFRLNNSTNLTVGGYTFDSLANTGDPRQYQRLTLLNGSRWQSATLNIGAGGALLISNADSVVVASTLLNNGEVDVVNSKPTFAGAVTISGKFNSDPSTNTFLNDVTVTTSGAMTGGVGDLFDFKQSFLIHSTNNTVFDLIQSTVEFSGGGIHTNEITGVDYGTNGMYGGNFEYGTLRLGSTSDIVCFGCGNIPTVASNGLYVGWLDLNSDTNLVANLRTPTTINLYYYIKDPRNAYLNGQTFQLLDCNGGTGGLLMAAIPEPNAILLVGLAAAGFAALRRRQS